MESLAMLAAVIGIAVLLSGPLAVTALLYDYVYIGGTLGALAVPLGVWWAYTVRGQAGWVGLISAAMGVWTVLQAWHHDHAQ